MPESHPEALRQILTTVRTIALVGASEKSHRASYDVMAYLQGRGYRVIPVNPRLAGQKLLGETVYPSLQAIPEPVDMADFFIASERVGPLMANATELAIPVLWLQLGVIDEEAAKEAEQAGLTVVMNRCPRQEIPRLGIPLVSRTSAP